MDSNHRPADYESARAQLADLGKRSNLASDEPVRVLNRTRGFPLWISALRPGRGLGTGVSRRLDLPPCARGTVRIGGRWDPRVPAASIHRPAMKASRYPHQDPRRCRRSTYLRRTG